MSVLLLLAMVVGGMRSCGGGPNQQQDPSQQKDEVIAAVGDYSITSGMIQTLYDKQIQQMEQYSPTFQASAKVESSIYAEMLDGQIRAGLYLIEAKKLGISIGPEDIIKNLQTELDQQLLAIRQQLLQAKELTDKSTTADFDAAVKKHFGKTPEELRTDAINQVRDGIKSPVTEAREAANLAQSLLPKVLATRQHISDDDLKSTYKTLKVKRILLTGPSAPADLAKAQADLKAGQSFEVVANRYSKDPAPKGKKPGDVETTLGSTQLADKAYAPLLTLKEGAVSDPISLPEGTAIYKLLSSKNDLPKDFDKNKEAYRTQQAEAAAQKQIQGDITALQKTTPISWKDPGWKALYDLQNLSMDLTVVKADRDQKLKEIAAEAKKVADSSQNEVSKKVAALAWYSIDGVLANDLSGNDLRALAPDRIQSIQAVANFAPGTDLQLELADLYADLKDPANLAQALITASEQNSDYGLAGQANADKIKTALRMNDALLPQDAKQNIKAALDTWAKSKADNDAEQKQADEATKAQIKQEEEDKKKLEAEQKQAAQQASKTPAPSGDAKSGDKK